MLAAVQAAPGDVPLRVHLAGLLADAGRDVDAVRHAAAALHAAPDDEHARALMARLLGADRGVSSPARRSYADPGLRPPPGLARRTPEPALRSGSAPGPSSGPTAAPAPAPTVTPARDAGATSPLDPPAAPAPPPTPAPPSASSAAAPGVASFAAEPTDAPDPWPHEPGTTPRSRRERREALERQAVAAQDAARAERIARLLSQPDDGSGGSAGRAPQSGGDTAPPRVHPPAQAADFVPFAGSLPARQPQPRVPVPQASPAPAATASPAEAVTLADVAGMEFAKERLESTVIRPLQHPEVRGLYRRGVQGGVLFYGPPGAGKSFLADAIAGELDAAFLPIDLRRLVQDGAPGALAAALHLARSIQPVLVCLDDIDALGAGSGRRGRAALEVVDQFLAGLHSEGPERPRVEVVATSSRPWDVDPALRRHGRFERTMFVTTPDQAARETILRRLARGAGVTPDGLRELAMRTPGFTASDLADVVDLAVRRKVEGDGVDRAQAATRVGADDLDRARTAIRPRSDAWFTAAREIVGDDGDDPTYVGLREYLRGQR